jgi:hypothetical protein
VRQQQQKRVPKHSFTGEFPTPFNREFFAALQGIKSGDQGNFGSDQGILLSTAIGTRLTRFDHLSNSMQYEEMLTLPPMI